MTKLLWMPSHCSLLVNPEAVENLRGVERPPFSSSTTAAAAAEAAAAHSEHLGCNNNLASSRLPSIIGMPVSRGAVCDTPVCVLARK